MEHTIPYTEIIVREQSFLLPKCEMMFDAEF